MNTDLIAVFLFRLFFSVVFVATGVNMLLEAIYQESKIEIRDKVGGTLTLLLGLTITLLLVFETLQQMTATADSIFISFLIATVTTISVIISYKLARANKYQLFNKSGLVCLAITSVLAFVDIPIIFKLIGNIIDLII